MPGHRLADLGSETSHDCHHDGSVHSQARSIFGRDRSVSRDDKLLMVDNAWHSIRGKILVEIEQVPLQIIERFALGLIIRVLVKIAKEEPAVFPPSKSRFHDKIEFILRNLPSPDR